jgi:hypothetical protein
MAVCILTKEMIVALCGPFPTCRVPRRSLNPCLPPFGLVQVMGLEALASASTQQELDGEQALASLSGCSGRFLVRRATVLLGRSSEAKGSVDVDLSREGPATKVSRRQAFLALRPDGGFHVENVGRQALYVDGSQVPQFCSAAVGHLSVLEVGGARLLFMVNPQAVDRILRRSSRLAV